VLVGPAEDARFASSLLPGLGVLTNMAEFPAVPEDASRFRLQVMAGHTIQEIQSAAMGLHDAIARARAERSPE
jgi:glycine C-acetyltransferase